MKFMLRGLPQREHLILLLPVDGLAHPFPLKEI